MADPQTSPRERIRAALLRAGEVARAAEFDGICAWEDDILAALNEASSKADALAADLAEASAREDTLREAVKFYSGNEWDGGLRALDALASAPATEPAKEET